MKRKKWSILIITVISAAVLGYMVYKEGARDLFEAAISARPLWLFVAVCLMGIYWLLESHALHLAVIEFRPKQHFLSSLKVSMVGQLFNCITPFASGGQPVQAYRLVKEGMPLESASCALMVKFIVYQSVLTFYSLITFLLRFSLFDTQISGVGILVLIGFAVNFSVIAGLLFICCFRKGTVHILALGIRLGANLRLVKDKQAAMEKMKEKLEGFYDGFAAMRRNLPLIFRMMFITAVQLTAYFLIPWAIYLAFGLSGATCFSIIAASAFVLNLTSFVPLPGAAGGAEFGFYTLFSMFFPQTIIHAAVLLWRAVTFYFPIVTGYLFTVNVNNKTMHKMIQN